MANAEGASAAQAFGHGVTSTLFVGRTVQPERAPSIPCRQSLKGRMMEELNSITVSNERLEDCRDVIEPDLQELIQATIASGFSAEEVLIAISELVAEDFATVVKVPSVH
jgi:hypothetical protein